MSSLIGMGNGQIHHVAQDPHTVAVIRDESITMSDDPYKMPLRQFIKPTGGVVWLDLFSIESINEAP